MATWEWDDYALEQRVEKGIEIPFCCNMIKLEIPDRREFVLTPPQIGFESKMEIDLGNLHCVIEKVGGDHAPDSSVIFVPEEKVLFLGDCLNVDIYHGDRSYSTLEVCRLVEKLSSYKANYYIDSHNGIMLKGKMDKVFDDFLLIANLVDKHGKNTSQIKNELRWKQHRIINRRRFEIMQAFINGLEKGINKRNW